VNNNQIKFLTENFDNKYCVVKDGIATHALSGELIPTEHIIYSKTYPDGVYELSESTCGGSMTNGNGGEFEPTEENKELYQCRIGRTAPKCWSNKARKCGVYSFVDVDRCSLNVKASELIKIVGIE